jgi:prepilin peptidase CpaA
MGIIAGVVISLQTDGIGLINSIMGGSLGLTIFIPFYFYRILGGGDVKLMMAIGTLVGSPSILSIALVTGLIGGVLSILMSIYYKCLLQVAQNTQSVIAIFLSRNSIQKKLTIFGQQRSNRKLPYAIAIGLATLIYVAVHST